jgi:heme a synthase
LPALALPLAAGRAGSPERQIAFWLLACCAMVFLMVVIGGITRLTESGLSITEWQPVTGIVPPLGQAQWAAEFERYQQIPQYRAIHADMTLAEFKWIFFWEYLHRLWGRLIGVVFALPFAYFLLRRRIPRALAPKLAFILALGALQGAIGWYMVASGLEGRIEVSQYRLALHLAAAVLIYAAMLWLALDLLAPPTAASRDPRLAGLRRGANAILALAALTLVAGSFVAGLRAGLVYNTFPLMDGGLAPEGYWRLAPWYLNWFENVGAVQFDHRLLAETTFAAIAVLWLWGRRLALLPAQARALDALLIAAVVQVGLGIATLVLVVPLALAVLHQAGALALVTAALVLRHGLRAPARL